MNSADQEYYRRRIEKESTAAEATHCDIARAAHLELAERYSAKLRLFETMSIEPPGFSSRSCYAEPLGFSQLRRI